MRVLLTTDTIGGVWTFTKEMCEGLLSLGHEVALVSVGRTPSMEQSAWCAATQRFSRRRFRYKALAVPLEWMESNKRAYAGAEAALLQMVQEFRADVVHSNQFCMGALPTNVPKVVTAHSDVLSWAEACRPGGLEETSWLRQYRSLVSEGLEGADAVVAPTHWMAEALLRGFSAAKGVRVIPNGRTLSWCGAPRERKLQAVSAGRRWDEAKQTDLLDDLDAVIPFVLAGETSLSGEGLCEADLLDLFRDSRIYIASSRYEPFGLAPLEAALCGCAVLANDIPSLREVWGDAALYFSGREALKRLLGHLVAEPHALRSARARSRERALQYSAEKMVGRYLALYTDLTACSTEVGSEAAEAYAC